MAVATYMLDISGHLKGIAMRRSGYPLRSHYHKHYQQSSITQQGWSPSQFDCQFSHKMREGTVAQDKLLRRDTQVLEASHLLYFSRAVVLCVGGWGI